MTIRDAVEIDLPAIVEIFNAAVRTRQSTAQLVPVSVEGRLQWFGEHSPGAYPFWVVTMQDTVAGWLSFHPFIRRGAYARTAEVSVYVQECFQRRGVATRLLGEAITRSPSLNLDVLLGLIFSMNTPSLELFARAGFARWGCLPRVAQVDGEERDLIIVGRRTDSA